MEDKYLKEKFSSLKYMEKQPRTQLWSRLEKGLEEKRKQSFQKNFNFAVAASLLILFSIVLTQIFVNPSPEHETAMELFQTVKDSVKANDSIQINRK